jgi:hypothetical protein
MGRWTSADPSGLFFADPGNPQSLNLYTYVVNNPLQFVDPNGLSWFTTDCTGQESDTETSLGTKIGNFVNHLFGCGGGGGGGGDDGGGGWMTQPPNTGHYVTVSSYPTEVMGMGHMGDQVDTSDTLGWATDVDFTPLDRVAVAVGIPFKGKERRDQDTYKGVTPNYLYHRLNDDQYRTLKDRLDKRYSKTYGDQHDYELFLNSCGQNVSDDLRAAHVRGAPPRWLFIPNLDYVWLRLQAH